MYTRVPSKKPSIDPAAVKIAPPEAIRLPQNYSGNAFTSDGHKRAISSDVGSAKRNSSDRITRDERKDSYISPSVPQSFPIPNESPLGYSDYPAGEYIRREADGGNGASPPLSENQQNDEHRGSTDIKDAELLNEMPKTRSESLFSSLLPRGAFKNNFPFGHGLGSEELLILGLMLSIYLSGEADGELMMLLGILLFAG